MRVTRAFPDLPLRVAYLSGVLSTTPVAALARALDAVCARAEQADGAAREVLLSLVDALAAPELQEIAQRLREEAAGESLLALERLVRHPPAPRAGLEPEPHEPRIPEYVKGRTLTLGERKSLARRPNRANIEKLLRDPHPEVIRRVLGNPRVTEDDVVRLAARRPAVPEVLAQIARSPTWSHRGRVRLALMLNPDTPAEVAAPLAGLLVRQELHLVAEATSVAPHVRALCLEHLRRRPPVEGEADEAESIQ